MIYFRKGFIKNNTFSLHFRSLKKFLKGRVMAPELAYALFTGLGAHRIGSGRLPPGRSHVLRRRQQQDAELRDRRF